jgi:UDP-N-acetylglucosamine--N-acetylmuramyl-(pentapeptide) pyrophosphoryl-undecaprenol N-acetylglucosamine transferase
VAARAARPLRVLITGGGTGGHLFPGLALAEAFQRAVPGCDVRFAGSHYGLESRIVPARGFRLYRLPVRGLFGVSWRRRLWVAAMLPVALLKALGIVLAFRPQLVIGVGGYASGPMLAVAVACRRVTVIQEQNAYPGMTNRMLGRFVRLAFLPVAGLEKLFPRQEQIGSPVRRDILALRERPPLPRPEPLIFVLGGSQGARAINQAMIGALPPLANWGRPLRILHQTGPRDLDWVREAYRGCPIPHEVVPFLDDMAGAFERARLVVSRSGASAVNEIVTARRASVFVPIPRTSGDHQLMNARRVAEAGAGIVLEQSAATGEKLAATLIALLNDPAALDRMEAACDRLFSGDAAGAIVKSCLRLIGRGSLV